MDESGPPQFIDHKETVVSVPRPRQMSASKMEFLPAEENESSLDSKTETDVTCQTVSHESVSTVFRTSSEAVQSTEVTPMSLISSDKDSDISFSMTQSAFGSSTVSSFPEGYRQDQDRIVQEISEEELLLLEAANAERAKDDKEVSEYCPGLAIRSLTLEDIQEKVTSPGQETGSFTTGQAADMSTSFVSSTSSSIAMQSALMSGLVESSSSSSESTLSSISSVPQDQAFTQSREQSAIPHKKLLFNPIEVERKFTIAEDTEEKLKSLGAKMNKEKTFTDVYYDNDDYSLITSDCWLRRRNDTWEAKIPLKSQSTHALFAPSTQYREVTQEKDISMWLVDQLKLDRWMQGDPIDLLAQAAGLCEFARFTTTRRSYNLPSCVISLDLTDHGFRVGEIEVMAGSPEEVPRALQVISDVAQQIGLSPLILA